MGAPGEDRTPFDYAALAMIEAEAFRGLLH
jgi:hypothetical protein